MEEKQNAYDFSAYQEAEAPPDNLLAQLAVAGAQWEQLSNDIDSLEAQLKAKFDDLKHLTKVLIPDLMDTARQEAITTMAGIKIKVKKVPYGNIPAASAKTQELQERRWTAFRWLDAHNFGHLIDREIKVTFARDKEAEAKELLTELKASGKQAKADYSVHHMRLQGFIRESLEAGIDLPEDVFCIHYDKQAEAKGSDGRKLRIPKAKDE